jgi:hypothetical protein
MVRSTIIVGNGLGMALDPEFFKLETAIDTIWNSQRVSSSQKELISLCLSAQGVHDRKPQGEDDFDILHRAVGACQFLKDISFGANENNWLTDDGQLFPQEIQKFITSVAWHFHGYPRALPSGFVESLASFIRKTNSHVATLNYDNLLYQKLIEENILHGYDGYLVDGFHTRTGFNKQHLERKKKKTFGYYLHLHGSPLFVDDNGITVKQGQQIPWDVPTKHLVLTYVKHKSSVIDNSEVLKVYWQYFGKGLRESKRL